jgi:hypothetical protein
MAGSLWLQCLLLLRLQLVTRLLLLQLLLLLLTVSMPLMGRVSVMTMHQLLHGSTWQRLWRGAWLSVFGRPGCGRQLGCTA